MITIQNQVPLAQRTTFQIGGEARYFVEVKSEEELREALAWAREYGVPFSIFGGGSNMLVSDEGFDGLVICIASSGHAFDGPHLTMDAGCNLLAMIREASARALGGWEKMAGIPGTVGGAVRGNAGAFGTEMKDVLIEARAFDTETGELRTFANAECTFSYRDSFFKRNPAWVVLSATVALTPADAATSAHLIEETIAEREKRHLQNVRAAGSYFTNPVAPAHVVKMFGDEKGVVSRESRVPAGWLIEKVGMKGAALGGASCSIQHPNYLVNLSGAATAKEVRELAQKVKAAVLEQFGVELIEEAAQL